MAAQLSAKRVVSPARLAHFEEALQSLYGATSNLSTSHIKNWIPPPKSGGHKGRYLWTDAFGVLNYLTLYRLTSSTLYLSLAKSLALTVHNVLGRRRDGTARLPGANDQEPLKGGLRIGKVDEAGSDGDGMYHHYLTLWMFALNRLSIAANDKEYNDLAIQLAKAIHDHFMIRDLHTGQLRMVWKISCDMKKVLVGSEGHLDAATGYVVFRLLQERDSECSTVLEREIGEYKEVMGREGKMTAGTDTLDLGMALWICHFYAEEEWAAELGRKCLENCKIILRENGGILDHNPRHRLAFREFGTCLGIKCFGGDKHLQDRAEAIIGFWEEYMKGVTEDELRPITLAMYAAALIPGAFEKGFLSSTH